MGRISFLTESLILLRITGVQLGALYSVEGEGWPEKGCNNIMCHYVTFSVFILSSGI